MGRKNDLARRRKEETRAYMRATQDTYVQYMTDLIGITLADPDATGGDPWGYGRIIRFLNVLWKNWDTYVEALTELPEADYKQEKLDAILRRITPDEVKFMPFRERYQWLPDLKY